jgi:hypothetical protein
MENSNSPISVNDNVSIPRRTSRKILNNLIIRGSQDHALLGPHFKRKDIKELQQ